MKHLAIGIGAAFCAVSVVRGQGLLDIGARRDDEMILPFSLVVSSSVGWDSNPGAASQTSSDGLPSVGSGSGYWENAVSLYYPLGRVNNRLDINASYSGTWYFDAPEGTEEFLNTGSLNLSYSRHVNERVSFGDSIYLSHQTQPDFQIGASINSPTSGYFYGSNHLWMHYRWSTRFSTITSWTINGIFYDDDASKEENNTRNTFSEKIRYAFSQKTTANLEYRFSFTDYPDNPEADSHSHMLLLGVERPLSRFFSMSLSGGPEWRTYDGALGSRTSPLVEAAIDYRARENTTFRFYYRLGLEDTGSAGTQTNLSQRTGVAFTHAFPYGFSVNLGLNLVNSDYSRGPSGVPGRQEDTFEARAGLNYYRQLWRRYGLRANYTFSMVDSDDEFAEYNRHQISLGISAEF